MRIRVLYFIPGLIFTCALLAQSDRGTLTGRILDPVAAVIPDARVEAVNQQTQVKYTGSTNEAGVYTLQQLPVGRYELTIEAPGFRRYVRKDIEVNVAQTVNLDVTLEVGTVEQVMEVSGAAPLLETTTSTVGTVVNRNMVQDLPLSVSGNMRNPEQFIFLTPGVTGDVMNTQINGSQSRGKEILVDGIGAGSPESGGLLFTYPSVEAFSEFKLISSNYSAEYGRTGGGFEVFTTRSGTNDLHGAVFNFLRNDIFDARGFFAQSTPAKRQNEFGALLGGPVVLPKIYDGRNRTFFHFVYSGFRDRAAATNALTTIPTVDMRRGDFSQLVDRNGNQIPIYDPGSTAPDGAGGFTRSQFPLNIIPEDRFSAVSRAILPLIPQPTNAGLVNNFVTVGSRKFDRDQINVKMDHALSDKSRLSAFVYIGTQQLADPELLPVPLSSALDEDRRSRWARLTHDYIFGPALLNHFAIGFTREGQFWETLSANQDWPNRIGLRGVETGQGNAFPLITFTGGYQMFGGGTPSSTGAANEKSVGSQVNNVWQVTDAATWIRGPHTVKFGVDARWMQTNGADFFRSQGRFDFSSLETAFPTTAGRANSGDAFASFLLGAVDVGRRNVLALVPGNRYRYLAGFIQDDWRVSRKFTLNLGLRYDVFFPRSERYNNMSGFDPDLENPAAGGRLGAVAFLGEGPGRTGRTSFAETEWKNFGPRLGFAYNIADLTVLRGGYGIYYAPGNATAGLRTSQTFSYGFNASPFFASTNTGLTPGFYWDQGFPQNFPPPLNIGPSVANGSEVHYIGREDGRPPYFQNWSFGIQRELPASVLVEVAYVGNKGTRLGTNYMNWNEVDPKYLSLGSLLTQPVTSAAAQAANIPLPYPGFTGSVQQALRPYPQYQGIPNRSGPVGNSTYHSLQAKAEKRMSAGLTYLVAYTWSKAISDNDMQAGLGPSAQTFYNRSLEKAISTNDVPHILAVSYLYELPFGPGKRYLNDGVLAKIAGGWTFTGIHRYNSGRPVVLSMTNTLPLFNAGLRPNVVPGVERQTDFDDFDPAIHSLINRAAFAAPASLAFGTAARSYTDLRAPAYLDESFGLIKRTALTERLGLTFRAEFFNVFNRVVFGAPNGNFSAGAGFGRIGTQANTPRQGQVALRLEF